LGETAYAFERLFFHTKMRKKVMLQYRYEKQAEINSFAVFFEQK
jgi:hypothetical protein